MPRLSLTLASLLALAQGMQVHDQLASVPQGWQHTSTPQASQSMVLQVALVKQNLDQLETHLASVSTPKQANYGKYLDKDAVDALFPVSDESKTAVQNWLKQAGITNYKLQGDSIWINPTVSQANKLLNTTFAHYTNQDTGVSKLRTTQYSIPEDLADHIDLIAPTTFFGASQSRSKAPAAPATAIAKNTRSAVPASCEIPLEYAGQTFITFGPECLKEQYGTKGYTPDVKSGSRLAYTSFLNESSSFSDLFAFEKHFNIPPQNFSVVLVNEGATDLPQPPSEANDGEANLDVQYLIGLAAPLPVTEFITAGAAPYFPDPVEPAGTPDENEPYLPYYEFLLSKPNSELPQVISNSYSDEEQTVPTNYAKRVCNLIGIAGLRGISILEGSGDEGVGASCLSQDGKKPQFNPQFPSSCPYVTGVGGTVNWDPEIAWSGSTGGFSNIFPRAWYQEEAVSAYLTTISPQTYEYYSHYTNFNGRGIPDIAAHSLTPDFTIVQQGQLVPTGGTSAATPTAASIIALLNDARMRQGKPPLGFLNPLIYLIGNYGFTDITSGYSIGCNGNNTQSDQPVPGAGVIPGARWNATQGWDTVTGFGTPEFQKLLSLALAF